MSGTFTVSKRGLRGFLNNSSLSFTFSNTLGGTILSKDAVPIAAGQWTDTGGSGGDFCMIPVAETDVDMGTLNYMALTYTMRLATSPTFQFRFACSLRHGGWIFGGFYNGLASFPSRSQPRGCRRSRRSRFRTGAACLSPGGRAAHRQPLSASTSPAARPMAAICG